MSLLAVAAADLSIALLDWGTPAALHPDGQDPSVAVVVMLGEPADTLVDIATGQGQERRSQGTASSTKVRAALAAVGADRLPRRGDVLVVAAGDYAGTWTVDLATPAAGDRLVLTLVAASRRTARAAGLAKGTA